MRYYEACVSCFSWQIPVRGDTGKLYKLTFDSKNHKFDGGRDYGCTCPAYRLRTGYCKHVIRNQKYHCNWREPLNEPELRLGTCPQCGGPTRLEVMEDE